MPIRWMSSRTSRLTLRITDVEYLLRVGAVAHQHPTMAGTRTRRNRADPYVVAMGSYLNQVSNPMTIHVVVSEESAAIRPARKISTACKAFGVRHCSLRDALVREFPNDSWP